MTKLFVYGKLLTTNIKSKGTRNKKASRNKLKNRKYK